MFKWNKGWIVFFCMPMFLGAQNILTTTSVLRDMAQNIAPDHCQVETIVPRGMDPHIYEPTPSDIDLVLASDLIFMNGLRLEGWLDKIITNAGRHGKKVTVTEGITPITSLEYESAPDPHAWMDLSLGLIYLKNMRKAFIEFMPDHAEEIEQKYDTYIQEMKEVHEWTYEQIQSIPAEHRVLITSHDAFQYFGRAYGMQLHAAMGLSTDADVKTGDVLHITRLLESSSIPAIFVESTINPKLLEQIASDYQVKIGGELFADALSSKNGPAGTYLDLFRHNVNTIRNALTKSGITKKDPSSVTQGMSYVFIFLIMLGLFISAYIKLS